MANFGPNNGQNKEKCEKKKKILLINHCLECIGIWCGASVRKANSSVQMQSLGPCIAQPQGLKLSHSDR